MRITAHNRRTILKLFNVAEAARMIGVGVQRLHRDIRAGRVRSPEVCLEKRAHFTEDDLKDISVSYRSSITGDGAPN